MRLQDVGSAIVKRLWIIIALTLVSALVGALIAYLQSPVYKVEIVVVATPPKNPTTRLPDATIAGAYSVGGILPSIANACESVDVAAKVSERLSASGIEITSNELLDKVRAIPEMQSTSIRVAITDGSPTRAAEIANAWGDVLALKTLPMEGNTLYDATFGTLLLGGTLAFTNQAVPPKKPTQPKPLLYVGLGAFIGLLVGFALVISLEYFDPHFRSVPETEETLGLPVLGTVPRERRGKPAALLSETAKDSSPRKAYAEIRSSLIFTHMGGEVRSVVVAPATPFESGPVVAANLAVSVANTGRKTLLIDGDMEGQELSSSLGVAGKPGLSDALEAEQNPYGKAIGNWVSGVDLLPAGRVSSRAVDLISLPFFEEALRELEELYDLVIVYAPPLISSMNGAVIASKTNASLVLVDADLCTRKTALEALAAFERLNLKPTGVVLANVKTRGREHAGAAAKAQPVPAALTPKAQAPAAGAAAVPASPAPWRERAGAERERPSGVGEAAPARAASLSPAQPAAAAAPAPPPQAKSPQAPRIDRSAVDEFRRLGEEGAPIPKIWLRALNSDKPDIRATADEAITIYYHHFLRRYRISEDNVIKITRSILRMMHREGEFATMSEQEAQQYLRGMLLDAGARFSTATGEEAERGGEKAAEPGAGAASGQPAAQEEVEDRKGFSLEERKRKKRVRLGRDKDRQTSPENEEGIDWE